MSIFNPWGEIRKLKAQLAAGYEAYRVEEDQQQRAWKAEREELLRANELLRAQLADCRKQLAGSVRRDPKTGRYLKQGH